jgi:hypothetical protein
MIAGSRFIGKVVFCWGGSAIKKAHPIVTHGWILLFSQLRPPERRQHQPQKLDSSLAHGTRNCENVRL